MFLQTGSAVSTLNVAADPPMWLDRVHCMCSVVCVCVCVCVCCVCVCVCVCALFRGP